MEYPDGFTIFMAGIALGLMAGHWLGQQDGKMQYNRGRSDALWEVWCLIISGDIAVSGKPSRHAKDGGRDNADKAA